MWNFLSNDCNVKGQSPPPLQFALTLVFKAEDLTMQLKKEDQKSFNMSQWVCIDLLIVAVRMIGNYHNNSHATAGTAMCGTPILLRSASKAFSCCREPSC